MTPLELGTGLAYLAAAVGFVVGLHLMRTPSTARRGNLLSATGMAVAIVATLVLAISGSSTPTGWIVLAVGIAIGSVAGVLGATRVKMTAIPQLVSLFNAVGGGAAAAIALAEILRAPASSPLALSVSIPIVLDVLIGSVTFSGSLIAAGKLQGVVSGRSIRFFGSRLLNVVAIVVALAASLATILLPVGPVAVVGLLVAALAFGVLMVLPIGGADAPVVVSLLNAFTGLAVAMAGFVIGNEAMIIAGALVGAAGTILTLQMAAAMNRSVANIIVGGFGAGPGGSASDSDDAAADVRSLSADDVAIQLAYAQHVIIVPGYGLAASQAQHEVAELAELLEQHGIDVKYAIHPVAGRMPGHMNVLLAEVAVPYDDLLQLEEANRAFENCDVALVVGANDVTNPAARRSGNPVSGMPILDVDHARSVVVLKRSMSPGYAGIPNELFGLPKTGMYFAEAKQGLTQLIGAVKQYVTS
ncbi:NAD(P)(+) transhydrogenase (Re/Si-specific) subunit beta [Diaminobutyricibacter tongyongensis]|uniref:NAD(P) transhydrogenase subunit beta n=1 Tax=Leifsonia tongyongensis TaxID=1268043 RepID=A0A6L9XU27_9MICO|nr:NAD(P)(+) transhydrogenase (Re/Si-specific) subunit beta [Diaminobutyricibacter tongyongensis]